MNNDHEPPAAWQLAWRRGFAPQLSDDELRALFHALAKDDPALIQAQTTEPYPLQCHYSAPVAASCPVAYAGWKGRGLRTVEEVEGVFFELCAGADRLLGEERGCRYFLTFWDETPRPLALRALLAEVIVELTARGLTMPKEPAA